MSRLNRFRNLNKEDLHKGKWISLREITYSDADDNERKWESAERNDETETVVIIARLRQSNRYVTVCQYRPPAEAPVLEFPAGLIDKGETPRQAALRELKEETGYEGEIIFTGPKCLNTPGLSSESATFVFVDIDECLQQNAKPAPCPDEGEELTIHLIKQSEAESFMKECETSGVRICSKVFCFFIHSLLEKNK